MERVTLTNICMITDGERVVVQERTGDWAGIAFPGGHVELGESLTDSVIREVWEETGLTIRKPRLCGVKNWVKTGEQEDRYIVFVYACSQFEGELRSSEEGRVWWQPLIDLPGLALAPGMLDTLRMYASQDMSEIYLQEEDGAWVVHMK